MPARLMLLVIVTVLFASAWQSDRQAAQGLSDSGLAANDKSSNDATNGSSRLALVQSPPRQNSIKEIVGPAPTEIPLFDTWMFGGITIALPDRMAAGVYRVVDNCGRVQTLTLSDDDLNYQRIEKDESSSGFYTSQDGDRTYYFIRITEGKSEVGNPKSAMPTAASTITPRRPGNSADPHETTETST